MKQKIYIFMLLLVSLCAFAQSNMGQILSVDGLSHRNAGSPTVELSHNQAFASNQGNSSGSNLGSVQLVPAPCTPPTIIESSILDGCRENITIYATASSGTVKWYTTPTGGTPLTNVYPYYVYDDQLSVRNVYVNTMQKR